MSNQTQAITKPEAGTLEYVPFGSQDKIKLNVKIVQDLIAVPTKSGKTCSQRDALKFMAMCQAKRLNPFEGDSYLIGYDTQNGPEFSLITAHQAFLKRAEIHPEYDGMRSGIILLTQEGVLVDREGDFHLQNENVVGGWATVFFKNRKYPTTRRIRLERFNKGFAQWKVDPAGMIVKCAESDALRSSFPTMLGGLYLREEVSAFIDGAAGAGPSIEIAESRLIPPPKPKDSAEPKQSGGAAAEQPEPTPATAASESSSHPTEGDGPGVIPLEHGDGEDPTALIRIIMTNASDHDITEASIMQWAAAAKMATPKQKQLSDLAAHKLRTICEQWPTVVKDING
ncbi:MAG TPA: phage recombination protein Bet [Candidatus Binatia bacterium]|nr:phage recombination protein Bet [Candidatus Binatia bacterium]